MPDEKKLSGRPRPYRFMVRETFMATVNGRENVYHAGHPYTVRVGEVYDDLDSKVDGWVAEGKVAL